MKSLNEFFEELVIKFFPRYREINNNTNEIQSAIDELNSYKINNANEDEVLNIKLNLEKIIENSIKVNKIIKKDMNKKVKYDLDFLEDSLKEWDKIDYLFVISLVGVYLALNKYADSKISNGKEIHSEHYGKPTANDKNPNKLHWKMPNDKMPEGTWGIERPNGGRAGGAGKVNGISFNHRILYGHDIFKPFEILNGIKHIEYVKPVLGSDYLGRLVKQFYHLFFDTFSETGIPVPGSTYFLKYMTKEFSAFNQKFKIVEKQDDFIQFFSIHIEDILVSYGIEGCLYLYFRIRQVIDNVKCDNDKSLVDIVKQIITIDFDKQNKKSLYMVNRTFKEYEIGIMVHSLIIWYQSTIEKDFRSKFNWISLKFFIVDMIQYLRLKSKWNLQHKAYIINELHQLVNLEIPENKKEQYKAICKENNIEYSDDIFSLLDNCNKYKKVINFPRVQEA